MSEGYQSGGTLGGKWGCGLAALVGMPMLGFVVIMGALGDCVPDAPCQHDLDWRLILGALAIAALVGVGGRAVINYIISRRTNGS